MATVLAGMFGAAAVAAGLSALGLPGASEILGAVLPVAPQGLDPFDAASAAVALLALAVGIGRRKQLAWLLGAAVLGAASVAQLLTLHHPIGGALAIVCEVALIVDRVHYRTRTSPRWRGRILAMVAIGAMLVALESVLLDAPVGPATDGPASDLQAVLGNVGQWLALDTPFGPTPGDLSVPLEVLDLAARLAIVGAMLAMLRAVPAQRPDRASRTGALTIARQFGRGALLPFQLGDDKFQFAGAQGLVIYGRASRTAVVLGDPIGPADDAWRAFAEFVEACLGDDVLPTVYQASASARGRLATFGYRTFRVGDEAVVDLPDFSLDGSRRANLRHTVTRAERGGVTVDWYGDGLSQQADGALLAQLGAIDREWRAHAGPELGFTIHGFDPGDMVGIAVAVAREADGSPSAFTTFRQAGSERDWVLDLMRRRAAGTPGALEATLAHAAGRLRDGCGSTLSLGLAPLAGLDRPDATVEERLLHRAGRAVRRLYDTRGLAAFKGKFDPRWEPRYVAVRRRIHLVGLVIALLRLHLAAARPVTPLEPSDATDPETLQPPKSPGKRPEDPPRRRRLIGRRSGRGSS